MWSPFKNTNGARNVLRQDDCWVDLPPRVLVKAFAKAFVKEAISPIIY